jgi:hypothetical protein
MYQTSRRCSRTAHVSGLAHLAAKAIHSHVEVDPLEVYTSSSTAHTTEPTHPNAYKAALPEYRRCTTQTCIAEHVGLEDDLPKTSKYIHLNVCS